VEEGNKEGAEEGDKSWRWSLRRLEDVGGAHPAASLASGMAKFSASTPWSSAYKDGYQYFMGRIG